MSSSPRQRICRTMVSRLAPLLLTCVAAGCGNALNGAAVGQSQKATDSTPRVETVAVEQRNLELKVEIPGTVEGYETVDLYAKVGGFLEKYAQVKVDGFPEKTTELDIGDTIEAGQTLAWLSIPEMEKQLNQKDALIVRANAEFVQASEAIRQAGAALESAEAMVQAAEAKKGEKTAQRDFRRTELNRLEGLWETRSVRRELVDAADFQLKAAEAAIKTAAARVTTAEKDKLAADANVKKSQADEKAANAGIDVADADRAYVEEMLNYAEIIAPPVEDEGQEIQRWQVIRRWLDPGAFVQPAAGNSAAKPLLTVTRTDRVRIVIDIPMDSVRMLKKGNRAVLDDISVLPGAEPFVGEVSRFSAALNMKSRMMRVEVDLDNADGRLRPGYYGLVTLHLSEQPDTLVIPSSALITEGDETFVYVASNGKARKTNVAPIYQDGIDVYFKAGDLTAGDAVVRSGSGQLRDGQEIDAVPAK